MKVSAFMQACALGLGSRFNPDSVCRGMRRKKGGVAGVPCTDFVQCSHDTCTYQVMVGNVDEASPVLEERQHVLALNEGRSVMLVGIN